MSQSLFNRLSAICPLTEACTTALLASITFRKVAKKELILREGEICRHIYFIEKGLVRSYYCKEEQEITSWFMKAGDVIISVNSFYSQRPGYEYIEALEDTELAGITYQQLQELYSRFNEMNTIGRILTERYYAQSEERLFNIRRKTAKERFDFLMERHPEIFQRALLGHIASYLGVSRETLSRIRGKK